MTIINYINPPFDDDEADRLKADGFTFSDDGTVATLTVTDPTKGTLSIEVEVTSRTTITLPSGRVVVFS